MRSEQDVAFLAPRRDSGCRFAEDGVDVVHVVEVRLVLRVVEAVHEGPEGYGSGDPLDTVDPSGLVELYLVDGEGRVAGLHLAVERRVVDVASLSHHHGGPGADDLLVVEGVGPQLGPLGRARVDGLVVLPVQGGGDPVVLAEDLQQVGVHGSAYGDLSGEREGYLNGLQQVVDVEHGGRLPVEEAFQEAHILFRYLSVGIGVRQGVLGLVPCGLPVHDVLYVSHVLVVEVDVVVGIPEHEELRIDRADGGFAGVLGKIVSRVDVGAAFVVAPAVVQQQESACDSDRHDDNSCNRNQCFAIQNNTLDDYSRLIKN